MVKNLLKESINFPYNSGSPCIIWKINFIAAAPTTYIWFLFWATRISGLSWHIFYSCITSTSSLGLIISNESLPCGSLTKVFYAYYLFPSHLLSLQYSRNIWRGTEIMKLFSVPLLYLPATPS
jgi:hypothetical protein